MTPIEAGLPELARGHPEWEPWLAVIGEILRQATDPRWDALVPIRAPAQPGKTPLLDGVTLALDTGSVRRVLERLIRIAARSGSPPMASAHRALHADVDVLGLFSAALRLDTERLVQASADIGVDPGALQAIATLLPVPFLQACHRRWALAIAPNWEEGYCPVCGAWPALAEVRGIERSRYLRCGRCGGGWESHCLSCPYCGTTNHEELVTLVPDSGRAGSVIDACRHCRGYVKTLTRLQGSPPTRVLLDDLASVGLDVAALEHGYKRPSGPGHALTVAIG